MERILVCANETLGAQKGRNERRALRVAQRGWGDFCPRLGAKVDQPLLWARFPRWADPLNAAVSRPAPGAHATTARTASSSSRETSIVLCLPSTTTSSPSMSI